MRLANWRDDAAALQSIRRRVFIEEQAVPEALEWDEHDAGCVHALALAPDGTPVGTGRLLADGHVGRMAVLASWRGQGVGSALLGCLVEAARARGTTSIRLNAQVRAIPFYERHGFRATGPVFDDAGIPHRLMILPWRR